MRAKKLAQVDYNSRPFPTCAELLDILRCSVTFNSCSDLLNGINTFMQRIKDGKGGVIKKIVRIKNGFKRINGWFNNKNNKPEIDVNKCGYADIKLNVIISSKTGSKTALIGEIQFMLKWMLSAKAIAHSWYGILRRDEFIENVNSMICDDLDYNKYKRKIFGWINHENLESLQKELLFNENTLLSLKYDINNEKESVAPGGFGFGHGGQISSMDSFTQTLSASTYQRSQSGVSDSDGAAGDGSVTTEVPSKVNSNTIKKKEAPILLEIGKSEWFKAFRSYFASILHFSNVIKTDEKLKEETFASRYINDDIVMSQAKNFIWGLTTSGDNRDSARFKVCKSVMKSPYFKGIKVCFGIMIFCFYFCCFA